MTADTPVTAAQAKKVAKPKKPANHPTYSEMVVQAIGELKERGGSSRQAILKYIQRTFNVGFEEKSINAYLKQALKAGVKKGTLMQSKGTGASGSFRLGEKPKVKKTVKPKKVTTPKKAVKKPAVKKATATKPKAVKSPAKKPKSSKKPAAKPKKPVTAKSKKPTAAKSKKATAAKPRSASPKKVPKKASVKKTVAKK